MFSVPAGETVTKKFLQHGVRNKAPPTHGDNLCAFQLSFLTAKLESLEDETFVLIMAVQNNDRAKSRRDVAANNILQILGEYAAANIYCAWETGTSTALRQRSSAVGHCRRDNHVELLDQHGGNAN